MIEKYTKETKLARNKMQGKLLSNEEYYLIIAAARTKKTFHGLSPKAKQIFSQTNV